MDAFFGAVQEMLKMIRVSSETAKRTGRAAALTIVLALSIIAVFLSIAVIAHFLWF